MKRSHTKTGGDKGGGGGGGDKGGGGGSQKMSKKEGSKKGETGFSRESSKATQQQTITYQAASDIMRRMAGPPVVAHKPIPGVVLSSLNKAPQITLSSDMLSCKGVNGGYRMVRASHGMHDGRYYWEAEIMATSSKNSHVRIGWSRREGELQGPVGYDAFSYGYRDISGSKSHNSIRNDSFGESFGCGDIVGCFLSLDQHDCSSNEMRFFKNGRDQGVAFSGKEIPKGFVYFPAISLYGEAEVRVNFGPSFILRHDVYGANAVSEINPLSPEDRKVHELRIAGIREELAATAAAKAAAAEVATAIAISSSSTTTTTTTTTSDDAASSDSVAANLSIEA